MAEAFKIHLRISWYRLLAHARSFPETLGIRLRLEIVGKNNTYTSVYISVSSKDTAVCQLNNSVNVKDNRRVYEGKDAFLRLPTSFGKSVHYEVLSFACLSVNKASQVGYRAG